MGLAGLLTGGAAVAEIADVIGRHKAQAKRVLRRLHAGTDRKPRRRRRAPRRRR